MRHYQRGIATTVILIIFLLAGVAIASGAFIFSQNQQKLREINSFEDCAKYYPVMESYPEQCNTPDGKHYTRELSEEDRKKLSPPQNSTGSVILSDFPLYPNSILVKKEYVPPCEELSGMEKCGLTHYQFKTGSQHKDVQAWFNRSHSAGWNCEQEAEGGKEGTSFEFSTSSNCFKGENKYNIAFSSLDGSDTYYAVYVP